METLRDRTIENQTIILDETRLVNCTLRHCMVFYRGGDYHFENTSFPHCTIRLEGAAKRTQRFLGDLGFLKQKSKNMELRSSIQ